MSSTGVIQLELWFSRNVTILNTAALKEHTAQIRPADERCHDCSQSNGFYSEIRYNDRGSPEVT